MWLLVGAARFELARIIGAYRDEAREEPPQLHELDRECVGSKYLVAGRVQFLCADVIRLSRFILVILVTHTCASVATVAALR